MEFRIPFVTFVKITVYGLVLLALYYLFPLIMLASLAVLLAVAAEPILIFFEKHLPRWLSVTLVMSGVLGFFAVIFVFIGPPFYEQLAGIFKKAPNATDTLLSHFPPESSLHGIVAKFSENPNLNLENWVPKLFDYGQVAFGGLTSLVLLLGLMGYLLVDGRTAYKWISAFFGSDTRAKLDQTAAEVTPVISAYMVGQLITSVLAAVFVYISLRSLGVPGALVLGVLAGIFDILPIVGFFLSLVPSVLFAFTVSPKTALIVFVVYCAYHAVENYVIVPTIYGSRLRVSGLVVLVGILIGSTLGGIIGAIIALPILASYPIIERIWLEKYIGHRTLAEHAKAD